MNKKAYSFINDIFVYLFFTLIVIMFLVLISHTKDKHEENMAEQTSMNDAKTMLLVFMRQQVIFEEKELSVAELLSLYETYSYTNDLLRNKVGLKIKETTERFFNKAYGNDWLRWRVDIDSKHTRIEIPIGKQISNANIVKIFVPSINNQLIRVSLYIPKDKPFIDLDEKYDE